MFGWRLDGVRMELFVGGISPPFLCPKMAKNGNGITNAITDRNYKIRK